MFRVIRRPAVGLVALLALLALLANVSGAALLAHERLEHHGHDGPAGDGHGGHCAVCHTVASTKTAPPGLHPAPLTADAWVGRPPPSPNAVLFAQPADRSIPARGPPARPLA
jgi:hypothetical protein